MKNKYKATKQVKKQVKINYFYLIYEYIRINGKLPSLEYLNLKSKQSLNYYVVSLKSKKFIRKCGYGTWEILRPFDTKQVKILTPGTPKNTQRLNTKDIRGHAYIIKLKIPNIRGWERRHEYLKKKGILYKNINLYGGCQQFIFKGFKVWLTNSSIVIYDKNSYMANLAKQAKARAIESHFKLFQALETFLGHTIKINGQYKFKVSRQHYSKVKDAFAKFRKHEKLKLYNDTGLWLVVDNSFNLHETETVSTETGVTDMDSVIKPFFNELQKNPGYTPTYVNNTLAALIQDRKYWAEHQKSHIAAIKALAKHVKELGNKVDKL